MQYVENVDNEANQDPVYKKYTTTDLKKFFDKNWELLETKSRNEGSVRKLKILSIVNEIFKRIIAKQKEQGLELEKIEKVTKIRRGQLVKKIDAVIEKLPKVDLAKIRSMNKHELTKLHGQLCHLFVHNNSIYDNGALLKEYVQAIESVMEEKSVVYRSIDSLEQRTSTGPNIKKNKARAETSYKCTCDFCTQNAKKVWHELNKKTTSFTSTDSTTSEKSPE